MNPFGSNTPPGCPPWDTGTDDELTCSKCGQVVSEDEIDEEASEAFEHVCIGCAQQERDEDELEN